MIPVPGNSTGDVLASEQLRLLVVRDGHGSSERRWETGAIARQDETPIRCATWPASRRYGDNGRHIGLTSVLPCTPGKAVRRVLAAGPLDRFSATMYMFLYIHAIRRGDHVATAFIFRGS